MERRLIRSIFIPLLQVREVFQVLLLHTSSFQFPMIKCLQSPTVTQLFPSTDAFNIQPRLSLKALLQTLIVPKRLQVEQL